MKKALLISLSTLILATSSMAYDHTKANNFNKFYSHLTQKVCANSKMFMKADAVMKMLRDGKKFTFLDVRTDSEASVIALSGKNALHIPIAQLFEKKNLNKLPTDRPLIIVCHSGSRATMAAVGLIELGFKNAHVIKGGLIALAKADNPKNAPMK
ncbi:rhodanese-like domain-containing protein [Sulfurimonas sp.]